MMGHPYDARGVTIVLLDTVTGERIKVGSEFNAYWWAEGSGSCDCNRGLEFGRGDVEVGRCVGAYRYLIVEADTDEYTLRELNADYPQELIERFLNPEGGTAGGNSTANQ